MDVKSFITLAPGSPNMSVNHQKLLEGKQILPLKLNYKSESTEDQVTMLSNFFVCDLQISICDIGNITYRLTMAKYLPILSRGDMER
jgi:hypothetical protein